MENNNPVTENSGSSKMEHTENNEKKITPKSVDWQPATDENTFVNELWDLFHEPMFSGTSEPQDEYKVSFEMLDCFFRNIYSNQSSNPVEKKEEANPLKKLFASLRYACDYFKKKNMDDFTDNSTEEEKWLFNLLSNAFVAGWEKSEAQVSLHREEKTAEEILEKHFDRIDLSGWRAEGSLNTILAAMEEYKRH